VTRSREDGDAGLPAPADQPGCRLDGSGSFDGRSVALEHVEDDQAGVRGVEVDVGHGVGAFGGRGGVPGSQRGTRRQ
jgi:hypothetical protein